MPGSAQLKSNPLAPVMAGGLSDPVWGYEEIAALAQQGMMDGMNPQWLCRLWLIEICLAAAALMVVVYKVVAIRPVIEPSFHGEQIITDAALMFVGIMGYRRASDQIKKSN